MPATVHTLPTSAPTASTVACSEGRPHLPSHRSDHEIHTPEHRHRQLAHGPDLVGEIFGLYFSCVLHGHRKLLLASIHQPTNTHIISHKILLKHFETLRHVSILSDHHQGALFLAKVILQYSQFNWYLQTRCCGSISCCVGMCCGAVARCALYAE